MHKNFNIQRQTQLTQYVKLVKKNNTNVSKIYFSEDDIKEFSKNVDAKI